MVHRVINTLIVSYKGLIRRASMDLDHIFKICGASFSHHILRVTIARHYYRSSTLLPFFTHYLADIIFVRYFPQLGGISILLFEFNLWQYIFGGSLIHNHIVQLR
jgi:hypothetical protein